MLSFGRTIIAGFHISQYLFNFEDSSILQGHVLYFGIDSG